MASTNKTPNYNLSQFQPTNKLERTDYNSDMTKIDLELKKNADNIGLRDTGWTTLSLSANVTSGTVKCRRVGLGLVAVVVDNVIVKSTAINTPVATLPIGYRPNDNTPLPSINSDTGSAGVGLNIQGTGAIVVSGTPHYTVTQRVTVRHVFMTGA